MKRFEKIKAGKRRGFSLVAVVIIAIAGMALVGGILYTFQAFSGSARQVISSSWVYNDLQEGVEYGKAFLRERMLDPTLDEKLSWKQGVTDTTQIATVDDLLIRDVSAPYAQIGHIVRDKDINEKGVKGKLNVYIYAMGYKSGDVSSSISADQRAKLPPTIVLKPTDGDGGINDDKSKPADLDAGSGGSVAGGGGGGGSGGGGTDVRDGGAKDVGAYLIKAVFKDDDTGVEKSIETALVQSMAEKTTP
jgi:uncharacterized membrane protein YgcG